MKKLYFVLSIICSLLLCACNTSIDEMLDDYNGNSVISDKIPTTPGDSEFKSGDMLCDEYMVYNDGMLNLAAPLDCASIKWVFTDPDNDYEIVRYVCRDGYNAAGKQRFYSGTAYGGRILIIYVPESTLEAGKTYKLTLTITYRGGEYTDSCGVVIYKHYDRGYDGTDD